MGDLEKLIQAYLQSINMFSTYDTNDVDSKMTLSEWVLSDFLEWVKSNHE